jgi:hypothetical protein
MRLALRTTVAAVAALAVAPTAAVVVVGPASADRAAKPKKPNPASTPYAMRGWGYGTIVVGGKVPAASAPTGFEVFGCTNRSDIVRENHEVAATLPQLGTVSAVETRAWTSREGDTVSAYAQNSIGQVVLSDSPLGTLLLDAVTTTARAFHDASGFHTETNTDLAKLRFQPPIGPAQTLALPAPGRPIDIPGVATITIAHALTKADANGARAFANGLKIKLHATDTVVRVAHAVAQIDNGATAGLFHGSSYAVGGNAAAGILDLGRNPLLKMKCPGTGGLTRTKSLAGLDLGGQVVLGAAQSQDMAQQNARRAWGFETSKVASLSLGGGALRIEGVVGRVNVSRSGEGLRTLKSNTDGTSLGTIFVNGQEQAFPDTGAIEIPGVAKIEPHVVEPLKNGLSVTALRISVLDGTGAVINLGNAQLQIRKPAPARR